MTLMVFQADEQTRKFEKAVSVTDLADIANTHSERRRASTEMIFNKRSAGCQTDEH